MTTDRPQYDSEGTEEEEKVPRIADEASENSEYEAYQEILVMFR